MQPKLNAIGEVFGADIVQVGPRSYVHVAGKLAQMSPLDAAVICSGFASYIGIDAVPDSVSRELVHLCDSRVLGDLERATVALVEIAVAEVEGRQHRQSEGTAKEARRALLRVMLRGMLSHSKIGQFSHCQKETVLKGVRARHLSVAVAELILDKNSEVFQDTKSNDTLFLWKDHHDGRQYFLNPKQVERVREIVASTSQAT
ncbi:MAG: hypothetical protein WBE37_25670 [Bryobacteraceae bacterium]